MEYTYSKKGVEPFTSKNLHLKGFEPLTVSLEGCCSIQLS